MLVLPLLLVLAGQVAPRAPYDVSKPERYMRVGSSEWGVYQSAPSSRDRVVQKTTNAYSVVGDLKLFPYGSMVRLTCVADVFACWTQTATISLLNGANAGTLQDDFSTTDGPGACFKAAAGIPTDDMPSREYFKRSGAVGKRAGVCTAPAAAVGVPCRIATDCHATTGACDTTEGAISEPRIADLQQGAFLVIRADSATSCTVNIQD